MTWPHDIVLYGAGPDPTGIPDPIPVWPPPQTLPFPTLPLPNPIAVGAGTIMLGAVVLPQGGVRMHVARGLAALLPRLREKLRADKASLTPDEAAALVWLEGVSAGATAEP